MSKEGDIIERLLSKPPVRYPKLGEDFSTLLSWLTIPGLKRSMTARQIAKMIDEKWPSGEGVGPEDVERVRDGLQKLVELGHMQMDHEPRFLIDTSALRQKLGER